MDTSVQELVSHLDDGDMAELRRRYRAGGLAFLQPRLGVPLYHELGARLDGGDRIGVWAMLIEHDIVPAPAWWGEAAAQRRNGAAAWIGLIPLVIVLAVVALLLGRCDDDDSTTTNALGRATIEHSAGPTTGGS